MALQIQNDSIVSYTTLDIAPDRYQTLTGTLSSNGVFVTGVGTLFLTEIGGDQGIGHPTINRRGYLFNGTDEVRRIVDIISNTSLVLEQTFTVNLAGAAVKWVPEPRVRQLSYIVVSGTPTINGVSLVANESGSWGDTAPTLYVTDPIIVNAAGAIIHILTGSQTGV